MEYFSLHTALYEARGTNEDLRRARSANFARGRVRGLSRLPTLSSSSSLSLPGCCQRAAAPRASHCPPASQVHITLSGARSPRPRHPSARQAAEPSSFLLCGPLPHLLRGWPRTHRRGPPMVGCDGGVHSALEPPLFPSPPPPPLYRLHPGLGERKERKKTRVLTPSRKPPLSPFPPQPGRRKAASEPPCSACLPSSLRGSAARSRRRRQRLPLPLLLLLHPMAGQGPSPRSGAGPTSWPGLGASPPPIPSAPRSAARSTGPPRLTANAKRPPAF